MATVITLTGSVQVGGKPIPLGVLSLSCASVSHVEGHAVADAATADALNFGDVATATLFMVKADQTISVKFGGSSTADVLTLPGWHIYWNTSVTSANGITVANSSGSTANLEYVIAGAT